MVQGNGPRARQRYRVADRDRVDEAMGYLLASVSRLAAGRGVPAPTRWAQKVLDEMVAEGYIEPQPGEDVAQ